MTILLVKDDEKIGIALSMWLKSYGYSVSSSQDAISAVSKAVKFQPDLVTSDINFPGGDGSLVAECLHALSNKATVPLIFITAGQKNGLRVRTVSLRVIGLFEKSFDSVQLLDTIESTHVSGNIAWVNPS